MEPKALIAASDPNGLLRKYAVSRVDGADAPGKKHHGCFLFVLDVDHDPDAVHALAVYAERVKRTRPVLYVDLMAKLSSDHCHAILNPPNAKDAVARAMELMQVPIRDLPPLAQAMGQRLSSRFGMCMETLITAYAFYAQAIEGYATDDQAYQCPHDERLYLDGVRLGGELRETMTDVAGAQPGVVSAACAEVRGMALSQGSEHDLPGFALKFWYDYVSPYKYPWTRLAAFVLYAHLEECRPFGGRGLTITADMRAGFNAAKGGK